MTQPLHTQWFLSLRSKFIVLPRPLAYGGRLEYNLALCFYLVIIICAIRKTFQGLVM